MHFCTVTNVTPDETLADAVEKISECLSKILASGLNQKAIIALLHDHTKLPKRDIKVLLEALPRMRKLYCK